MTTANKDKIRALLKSIETADPEPISVLDETRYIQHNPQTHEGSEGLAALFTRLSLTQPRVNIVRAFEDGDFVFGHTEYDFSSRRVGFEVFRFEGNFAVEHWDNIQPRLGPNHSGHSMVDGPTESTDHGLTEQNRELIKTFAENVLVNAHHSTLTDYVDEMNFVEHNPHFGDDLSMLVAALAAETNGQKHIDYQKVHRVLAEGDFALCVSEGYSHAKHAALYDLYRISQGNIVEHWDTTETIAPRSEWKNKYGKF